jgi:hypothetical protein
MDRPRCSASADDRRPPMSPVRRLSLRARMLVIIVGVTTILLLIMGTVSTYLFVRRVDGQAAAATRRLNQLADILVSRPWEAEANVSVARQRRGTDHGTGNQAALGRGIQVADEPAHRPRPGPCP